MSRSDTEPSTQLDDTRSIIIRLTNLDSNRNNMSYYGHLQDFLAGPSCIFNDPSLRANRTHLTSVTAHSGTFGAIILRFLRLMTK